MQSEIANHNSRPHRLGRAFGEFPALVLNADYRPLSYFPLSLWSWQDAVRAVFSDKVDIISYYDQKIHSPSFEMNIPSVISLKEYVKQDREVAFTRFNLFLRDGFECVYCGSKKELTFDHVIPRSMGGKTNWENIVAACTSCNSKKGGRTPKQANMPLKFEPRRPNIYELQEMAKYFSPKNLHKSWLDYLYWEIELLP